MLNIRKLLYTLLILLVNNVLLAQEVETNLYATYLSAHKESKKLQEDEINTTIAKKFQDKYFFNEYNLLYGALGQADLGDCDSLYLKPSCYQFSYHQEQKIIDDEIGCLYIYARPKIKPEEYLIQIAILYMKVNEDWKIIGNRTMIRLLKDFTYMTFKGETYQSMFTDICKSKVEIKILQKEIYKNILNNEL